MDELNKTRQTYEKIASAYAQQRQDRSVIADMAQRFVNLVSPGSLVFDVGCGPGFDTAVFQKHNLRAVGLDYSLGMMQAGRRDLGLKIDSVQADMRQLPLPAQSAAGLWVSASLLHIPRAEVPDTLAEFKRVLKPDGVLLTAVKLGDGEDWVAHSYGQQAARFFTYWQPTVFDEMLQRTGFVIVDGYIDQSETHPWLVRFSRSALTIDPV